MGARRAPGKLSGADAQPQAETVVRRTLEVRASARRFELATADSVIAVPEQDEQLKYTCVQNLRTSLTEDISGQSDREVFAKAAASPSS